MSEEMAATQTAEEEDPLLAALMADEEDEVDEVEDDEPERPSRQDEKLAKEVKALKELATRNERQRQADKLYSEFMAEASDTAKQIYAVLADDDMTPAQMKKVIDAATRKAQEIDEKTSPDKVEEAVEARVNEELANRWGVSPISTSKSIPADKVEEYENDLWEKSRKGNTRATAELILNHHTVPADLKNR